MLQGINRCYIPKLAFVRVGKPVKLQPVIIKLELATIEQLRTGRRKYSFKKEILSRNLSSIIEGVLYRKEAEEEIHGKFLGWYSSKTRKKYKR